VRHTQNNVNKQHRRNRREITTTQTQTDRPDAITLTTERGDRGHDDIKLTFLINGGNKWDRIGSAKRFSLKTKTVGGGLDRDKMKISHHHHHRDSTGFGQSDVIPCRHPPAPAEREHFFSFVSS